jgi:hypothetical protein
MGFWGIVVRRYKSYLYLIPGLVSIPLAIYFIRTQVDLNDQLWAAAGYMVALMVAVVSTVPYNYIQGVRKRFMTFEDAESQDEVHVPISPNAEYYVRSSLYPKESDFYMEPISVDMSDLLREFVEPFAATKKTNGGLTESDKKLIDELGKHTKENPWIVPRTEVIVPSTDDVDVSFIPGYGNIGKVKGITMRFHGSEANRIEFKNGVVYYHGTPLDSTNMEKAVGFFVDPYVALGEEEFGPTAQFEVAMFLHGDRPRYTETSFLDYAYALWFKKHPNEITEMKAPDA